MYPMLGTRPDLAYTVAALGQHSAKPDTEHQRALDVARSCVAETTAHEPSPVRLTTWRL